MKNFSQDLQQTFRETPNLAAIHLLHSRQNDQMLTYRDLMSEAAVYAHALDQFGIAPGEVVILILPHGRDLVSAFFGAILRGAIPSIMPFLTEKLLPDQYRTALSTLFKITAPTAVITYLEFAEEVRKASQGSSVRSILLAEEIAEQITLSGDLRLDSLGGLHRSPEDIVFLQHSSGTTGLQKGVALSHHAVFNQIESYSRALDLKTEDVVVSWLPLYHDMGLIAGFILPILSRIPLVLMSPFDWVRAPHRLMQAVSRYHGTLSWLPNFAYNFCAQKIRDRNMIDVDLSSWRAVVNCSEPMHWKSHTMFLERFQPYGLHPEALATSYAMAENVFAVTQGGIDSSINMDVIDRRSLLVEQIARPAKNNKIEDSFNAENSNSEAGDSIKMLSAGRPIDGTQIRVLNSQGRDLPERCIGEIALFSNCMLTSYYNRPDLTTNAFQDGWYLTGDLGYLADGEVYITGRKKDLIIVGGKNIYPQDMERLASEVDGVHPGRVVSFGVFNEETGTEDVILLAERAVDKSCVPETGQRELQNDAERIASQIRQYVTRSSDVALRYVHVLPRNWLIKTSSGKIARQANREKYLTELAPQNQLN